MHTSVWHSGHPRGQGHHSRANSDGTDIRLGLAGDRLRNVVIRGFRLSKARFDNVPLFVQRPESVAEHIRRVVFPLELHKPVPVLAETGFSFVSAVAATQKLEDVRNYNRFVGGHTYAWEGSTLRHRLQRFIHPL